MKAQRTAYIVSDFHLGGDYSQIGGETHRGFRLCTRPSEIAKFIDWLSEEQKNGPVELVINGDFVDFLAERNSFGDGSWSAFTEVSTEAVQKFEKIVRRDKAVFDALARFLEVGGRFVLLLGNHDVELSLPAVRSSLSRAIGAEGRNFHFIYDGEAYEVGDALIEHGNRYDSWNQIDHDSLRRVRSLQSRNQEIRSEYKFTPPPGSELVASVINKIKSQYPFVDLLKPETSAVVPLLLALEPSYRRHLGTLAMLAYKNRTHGLKQPILPSFGGDISTVSTEETALKKAVREALGSDAELFLANIGAPYDQFGSDISTVSSITRALGIAELLTSPSSKGIVDRMDALRRAMRGVQNAQTFDRTKETASEYMSAAKELVGGKFRHVVFGHTHLAKKVDLGNGCWYLNSGTWADMLEFPDEILADGELFSNFVQRMSSGDFSSWTLFRPTYVRLEVGKDDKVIAAELCCFR